MALKTAWKAYAIAWMPSQVRLFAARLQRGGGAAAAATARPPVRRLLAPASLPNQSLHSHCRCPPSLTLN